MSKSYIYAMCDPRDGKIRYVGKANNVKHRVQNHLCPASLRKTRHTSRWLAGLVTLNLTPEIRILETIEDGGDWEKAERNWIQKLRSQGEKLTNILDGGEGGATYGRLGKKNSPEMKAKIRATRIGKSINQRDPEGKRALAIRAAWERRRAKAKELGTKLSWGKHSPTTRSILSQKAKGRDTSHAWKASVASRIGKPLSLQHRNAISKGVSK